MWKEGDLTKDMILFVNLSKYYKAIKISVMNNDMKGCK